MLARSVVLSQGSAGGMSSSKLIHMALARDISSLPHRCFHRETHNMAAGCPPRESGRKRERKGRERHTHRDRQRLRVEARVFS